MEDFGDFDSVFSFKPDYHYDHRTVETIQTNRRNLGNQLFFDRLLRLLNIEKPSRLYPPQSNQDLRALHQAIVTSASPDHHKQALIYYILRDLKVSEDVAGNFSRTAYLPAKYETYIRGLWHMDHMHFESALEYLTQPSILPTFPDEIIYTLIRHASKESQLPLAYYNTVSPPLANMETLNAFFRVLCRSSITEAFFFARSRPQNVHRHLLETLIAFVLSDHSISGAIRGQKGLELVSLPMDDNEEQWFEDYLLKGRGKGLHGARDTAFTRRVATGRFQKALEDGSSISGRKLDGINWDIIKESIDKSLDSVTSINGTLYS